ncbi:MAG: hypothetical protein AAF664_20390 [Planctomycetota bacterium]
MSLKLCIATCTFAMFGCTPDFGGEWSLQDLTYDEYRNSGMSTGLDPKGGSSINYHCVGTRDGSDEWWQIAISDADRKLLVASVLSGNEGNWSPKLEYPSTWTPDGSPPSWWLPTGSDAISWCNEVGDAERFHGWYFIYDKVESILYCWHWNHQWASHECHG